MTYKDKDKQREANRKAQAKFKAKGITKQDMEGITDRVLPEDVPAHGLTAGFEKTEFPKTVKFPTHKRGKDIKCFEDLPKDVQETIRKLSTDKVGLLNQREFINRTAIAINYQHQFPNSFHSTGVT